MKNIIKSIDKNDLFEKLGIWIVLGYTFVLLICGCIGPMLHAEIDSNALPVISLQYRGSLTVNQSDIEQAKIDFPQLYEGINSYDDLRSSKLIVISEDEWFSFYFPIYPLLCIPVKLLLAFLGLDQQRTFFITNALLISGALMFLQLKLKASHIRRIAAVLMLAFSPIIYYNNYINYEAFIFAMLIIAMVLYYNGNRKLSGLFVSLGAMSNSTVAAIGLVMIAEYGIKILHAERKQSVVHIIKKHWKETIKYAVCFVPCLVPFVAQKLYLGRDTFSGMATTENLLPRILTYLFDPTIGYTLFAPLALIMFFVFVLISIYQKRYKAIAWLCMFLGVVCAYSLMTHINCGMLLCARYVIWSYPIIPIFIVTIGWECISKKQLLYGCYGGAVFSSFVLMLVNPFIYGQEYTTNSKFLLKYMPAMYNQYSATFYCRTLHIDGAYDCIQPAYYKDPVTTQIYKLIFKADPGQSERVLNELKGDEASMEYLARQLDKVGDDGKFHYINFPVWGKYTVYEKTEVEKLNLVEGSVITEQNNISCMPNGDYNIYSTPITIAPNSYYEVRLDGIDIINRDQYSFMYVDFYGGAEYDSDEQQHSVGEFDSGEPYIFSIYTGDFEGESMNAELRIVTSAGPAIKVESLKVTLLESVK